MSVFFVSPMERFYNAHYKKLLIIPLIILLVGFSIILINYNKIGDIVQKDVTLKGGITATISIEKPIDTDELKSYLISKFPKSDVFIRKLSEFGTEKQIGIIVEASEVKDTELKTTLEEKLNIELTNENYSVEEMGPTLGKSFYKQMLKAILFAFFFMALVVFITFRNLVPSLAVVMSGFFDIVITLAIVNLIGMRLSMAGVAAFMMILGYAIDTDILLTTRVLKRKEGSLFERLFGAMKTGLTMTVTTIVALSLGYLVSTSYVLKQMFSIILIGLFVDVFITYLFNAGILTWFVKKHEA